MKRIGLLALTVAVVILLASVLSYSGDGKSAKKEVTKNCQMQMKKDCAAKCDKEKCTTACTDKHAKGECKNNDGSKCDPAKCSTECKNQDPSKCDPAKCATECKEKCTGHDKPNK